MKETSKKLTKIYYLHKGDNIPFYIGKTIRIQCNSRLNIHKKLYGKHILLETIDIVPTLEWIFWEKHYISLFKTWGFELVNKNNGGGGCITHKVSNETRIKIGNAHKGKSKPFNENHKINHKNSYQTMDRTWINNEWKNNISKSLKGRKVTWNTRGDKECLRKKINQYDLNNNFIKEWKSISEASKYINNKGISSALRGKQKQAGGFIWKYA